jgi:hypothetical protein
MAVHLITTGVSSSNPTVLSIVPYILTSNILITVLDLIASHNNSDWLQRSSLVRANPVISALEATFHLHVLPDNSQHSAQTAVNSYLNGPDQTPASQEMHNGCMVITGQQAYRGKSHPAVETFGPKLRHYSFLLQLLKLLTFEFRIEHARGLKEEKG